tara:strand:- start:97 stop:330 length:234 start_codon:yes stop_codon:yes gene_type:complete
MSTRKKGKNDRNTPRTTMLEEEVRCSCWETDRKGRPLKADYKSWKEEVMADGHGHCKHCNLKIEKFWPMKKAKTALA